MAHVESASVKELSATPRFRLSGIVWADGSIPRGGIDNALNFQDVFIRSPALFHHVFPFIFWFKEKRG